MSHVVTAPPDQQRLQADLAPHGVTIRAAIIAAALCVASHLLIIRVGFVRINWVPYVVPPVPALMFLLFLYGANKLLHALSHRCPLVRPLTRGELFLIYAACCITLSMDRAAYIIHYLLVAHYYGTDVNHWRELFAMYPDFWLPRSESAIRAFFEGTASGKVPWHIWTGALIWWGLFNLAVVWTVSCLVAFFRRQWVEGERLTFPLLFLPLAMTGGVGRDPILRRFFRDPLMWAGFSLAAAYNAYNIFYAFFPVVPRLGWYLRVISPFSEGILRYFQPVIIYFNPELLGLSYLISGEVLLSTWFFYFFMKLIKVAGYALGLRRAGFPYYQEASAGACFAIVLFMFYVARRHFSEVWQRIIGANGPDDSNEPLPYRLLLLGLLAGAGAMIYMYSLAGLPVPAMLMYLASLFTFILVAARVRAEAGPPSQWNHPWGIDHYVPVHLFGSRALLDRFGRRGLTLYFSLFYLGRTIFAHSSAQYAIDSYRLADHGPVSRRAMLFMLMLGAAIGMFMAFYNHVDIGYKIGQAMIGSGAGRVGMAWSFNWSRWNYTRLWRYIDQPGGPDTGQAIGYAAGFAFTWVLIIARMRITNFPFHPLGFILGTLYGDNTPYWFPFLVAWAGQRLTLRYGGLLLYRRFVPTFLGIAFGHIFIAGIVWRIFVNYFIDPVISARYYINLGG